jgi:DnaJ family protein C protein 7
VSDIDTAVKLYDECLGFDSLNNAFNVTILYNSGCALAKVGKNEDALMVLGKAINMNKEYVKVYMKRGDIYMVMEKYQEAVHEFTKVKELAPQTPGIREKVKNSQIELKKSKRKDYYNILELAKDAGESEIKKGYRLMAIKWHPDKHQ